LIEFQTGIKSIETVRQELANRLVTVSEQLLFCPKFISFQYPNFPNSKAPQTLGAISLLQKNGLMDLNLNFIQLPNSYLTVTKDLPKSYGNGNDKGNGNGVLEEQNEISEFNKAFDAFYEMRRKIKKPATPVAQTLILKELKKIAGDDEDMIIAILNQSTRNCWQDVYPLKVNGTKSSDKTPLTEFKQEEADYGFPKN
jgi:hypothetical protein